MGNHQTNHLKFMKKRVPYQSSLSMASIDQVWSTTALVVGHCFGTQLGLAVGGIYTFAHRFALIKGDTVCFVA